MWELVVVVWVLMNGQMEERNYTHREGFETVTECREHGALAVVRLANSIDEVVGSAYLCVVPPVAAPMGEYDA